MSKKSGPENLKKEFQKKIKKSSPKLELSEVIETAAAMAEIIKSQELTEFSLEFGDARIQMFKEDFSGVPGHDCAADKYSGFQIGQAYPTGSVGHAYLAGQAYSAAGAVDQDVSVPDSARSCLESSDNIIFSPMAGTFYRAPSPDSKPYVEENQNISKGQVLCILEAMKLMNEFKSEKSGLIKKIFKKDGEVVAQGDKLFLVE
jgi:acetyl-CoA carboxylase biotin carboxyl carrier protein